MKKLILLIVFVSSCFLLNAQSYQWTWMNGSNLLNQPGVYGTIGQPLMSNSPGARNGSSSWTDTAGNFWFFGGSCFTPAMGMFLQYYNDLWKYNSKTNEWTWVNGSNQVNPAGVYGTIGVASDSSLPNARSGSASWLDDSGNYWIYGGYRNFKYMDNGFVYNDLWKYNPHTNQWTWINGSNQLNQAPVYGTKGAGSRNNSPGGRYSTACWKDSSGNFWLMGGNVLTYNTLFNSGYNFEVYNDLWKYNPHTNEWTWVEGSNKPYTKTSYGLKGVATKNNMPGARSGVSSWTDKAGNFWLFGGDWMDSIYTMERYNDLWKFNPSTAEWTWVSGSNTANSNGNYVNTGVPDTAYFPQARGSSNVWTDNSGNFWLFGGEYSLNTDNELNDLWKYNPVKNEWTWVSGSNQFNQTGNYGSVGVSSPGNIPGSRSWSANWKDKKGDLWLLGGFGYCVRNNNTYGMSQSSYNDLWKFSVSDTLYPNPPSLYIARKDTTSCSFTIDIPVYGKNLNNVSTLKGTIVWDTTVVSFGNIKYSNNLGLVNLGMNTSNAAGGYLGYYLGDSNNTPHSIPDSTPLFTLQFYPKTKMTGGTIISFDTGIYMLEIDTAINFPAQSASYNFGYLIFSDTPQISWLNDSILFCSAGCAPIHYQWYLNGNPIAGDTINTVTVNTNGVYTVVVTYRSGNSVGSHQVKIVLPVNLISFNAKAKDHTALLNWATESEINTKYFEVERSLDGKNFELAGKVIANNKPSHYAYNDKVDLKNKIIFYKLGIVDIDGKKSYSQVREVVFNKDNLFTFYPNPAHETIIVNVANNGNIILSDLSGKTVKRQMINAGENIIVVSNLSHGVYYITFETEMTKQTQKILIE